MQHFHGGALVHFAFPKCKSTTENRAETEHIAQDKTKSGGAAQAHCYAWAKKL